MATVYKLPSGSWRVQIRRGPIYLGRTFKQRTMADRWAARADALVGEFRRHEEYHALAGRVVGNLLDLQLAADDNLVREFLAIALEAMDSARVLMETNTVQHFLGGSGNQAADASFDRRPSMPS